MSNSSSNGAEKLHFSHRIALAYAPKRARSAWLALFLLDQRLQETARPGREHLMIQLRLAWWRDRLRESGETWPVSEPVLASLKSWNGRHGPLTALVDGWEAEALDGPGSPDLDAARLKSYLALADLLSVTNLDLVQQAVEGAQSIAVRRRMPRTMRPLLVLQAIEGTRHAPASSSAIRTLGRILRAGLLGR